MNTRLMTILLLITPLMVISQTKEEAFFYAMKIYNETIESNLRSYALNFDEGNFVINTNNEFKRDTYLKSFIPKLENGLNSVNFNQVFAVRSTAELGQYSFSLSSFPIDVQDVSYEWYYKLNPNEAISRRISFAHHSINWDEFKMFLNLPKEKAEELLSRQTDFNGKVNRNLFVKIIFSIVNRPVTTPGYQTWIKSYIHSIEFYEDYDLTILVGKLDQPIDYFDKVNGVKMKEGEEVIYYKDNYFQNELVKTNDKSLAKYYRIIKYAEGKIVDVKDYFISGRIMMEGSFSPYCVEDGFRNGKFIWYRENGYIKREVNYRHGVQQGCVFNWEENGRCFNNGSYFNNGEVVSSNTSCQCINQPSLSSHPTNSSNVVEHLPKALAETQLETSVNEINETPLLTEPDLINNYLSALGERVKVDSIFSLNIVYSMQLMGLEVTTNIVQGDGKYYMSMTSAGLELSKQKYDGLDASAEQMGKNIKLTLSDKASLKEQAIIFPERFYNDSKYITEITGLENVNGKPAYKFMVIHQTGTIVTGFYDKETFLKVKEIQILDPKGKKLITTIEYSDYKTVDGIAIPHVVTLTSPTVDPIIMKLTTVKVNDLIDPLLFKGEKK